MVLLLLFRSRVPRLLSLRFLALTLVIVGSSAVSVRAAERTFVLTPADLVTATELFGAEALSRSGALEKKTVGLKSGALRFAKSVCPSLLIDPTRRLTRIRILAGPDSAPLVVGKKLAPGLATALWQMGASTWLVPATGKTRQAQWVAEGAVAGVIGFSTTGFATGDLAGALGQGDAQNRSPGFRITVDVPGNPGVEAVQFALVLTSELPSKRVGKPGKRTECVLVAPLFPVDITVLRDLVTATPLSTVTRHRLNFMLDTMQNFLDRGSFSRAARNARTFALEVAQRSDTEISPAFAEPMINRANAAAEALSF